MRDHQTTWNKFFLSSILLGLILGFLAYGAFAEREIGLGIGFAVFALLILCVIPLLMPYQYRFDEAGVTICYLLLSNERYLWNNIYHISVTTLDSKGSLFLKFYKIEGQVEGKKERYHEGTICKTFRSKRLIEKYWDGTIEGYWDVFKPDKSKRKGKKQPSKTLLTEEVAAMERNIRAEMRPFLGSYEAQAALYGMELQVEYEYMTADYDTVKSRPTQRYTYCVSIGICRPGETDEEKIWCAEADLLHVRPGKNRYRGVENKNAQAELKEQLDDILKEISSHAIT